MNTVPLFRSLVASIVVVGSLAANSQTRSAVPSSLTPPVGSSSQAGVQYGNLPLSFEANQGQAGAGVKFMARGSGYGLDLTDSGAVLSLTQPTSWLAKSRGVRLPTSTDIIRLQLAGASRAAQVSGTDELPGVANYMIGNDPAHWHTNLPTYAKVKYTGVYPGVDLVYYGNQSQLEYDFVVAPKANSEAIRIHFAGGSSLNLASNGDLKVTASHGAIVFDRPVVYQIIEGQREPVQARFKLLADNQVGFALGRYDRSQPLIIDPVLTYSTYLGSLGGAAGAAGGIAVDSMGNAYITGDTASSTFPVTTGSFQVTKSGTSITAFVSKLNPAGTALVYSTYLGGSSNPEFGDGATGVTVDSSGDAYLVGITGSTNFPVTGNAYQMVNEGAGTAGGTPFVTKLNPAGNGLVYSTFLGGSATDQGNGIAIDSAGNAYVTGIAASSDFPVTNGALQLQNGAPTTTSTGNAFVTKLDATGSHLIYSTYLGGKGTIRDSGSGIAVDSSGDAYVTGDAASTDFPVTTSAFQTVNNAATSGGTNAFVAKINPTGTALIYSTYLGGSIADTANGIALDSSNNAYVVGTANSSDFPVTTGAFQAVNNAATGGGGNAFVTKISPAGAALVYSTYLGGSGGELGNGISVDLAGDAYVTGTTFSSNFPVTNGAFQSVNNGPSGDSNSFISKLNPAGAALLYSTYLGGSGLVGGGGDFGLAIAVDGSGNAYVFGYTGSADFPVTKGAYDTTFVGSSEGGLGSMFFVAKLAIGSTTVPTIPTTTTLTSSANPQIQGTAVTFTSIVTEGSGTVTPTGNVVFSFDGTAASTVALNGSGEATYTTSVLAPGQHTILASYGGSETDETSSANLTQTINTAAATTTTTLTSSSLASDQNANVTFTAAVTSSIAGSITGTVTFYDGTTPLGTGTLTSGSATFSTSSLSVGMHSITATFGGDTLYLSSTSSPLQEVVAAPGITFAANPTTLTVAKGLSGTVVITATPAGGYTGMVTFACGTLPADASCSFAPTTLNFTSASSAAQTSTLTFSTKATASAALTNGPGRSIGPTIFAALLLIPFRFRKRLRKVSARPRFGAEMLLVLFVLTATAGLITISGCGSSGPAATPAGTYTVPVTITAGSSTSTVSLTIVVQ